MFPPLMPIVVYYIGNKFNNDDCHMNAYIVRDTDGLVSVYTDLLNTADQILRI